MMIREKAELREETGAKMSIATDMQAMADDLMRTFGVAATYMPGALARAWRSRCARNPCAA